MKKDILWPVIGFIGIAAVTFLSYMYNNIWFGFFSAIVVGILIIGLMVWQMSGQIESAGTKKTIIILLSGLVILHVFNSTYQWIKSENQKSILIEIRRIIDGSIAQIEAEQILIKSLRYSYQNEEAGNLEEAFRAVAGDCLQDDGMYLASDVDRNQDLKYSVEIPTQDSIVIYVVAEIAKGLDSEFTNTDGQTGKYEAYATLTPSGVRYVRQN